MWHIIVEDYLFIYLFLVRYMAAFAFEHCATFCFWFICLLLYITLQS